MTSIDLHAHFLPRGAIDAARSGSEWFGARVVRDERDIPRITIAGATHSMASPRYWDSWDERVERLDRAGVGYQVLSSAPNLFRYDLDGASAVRMCREINDEIAEVVSARPERFGGLCVLPLQDVSAAVSELERSMASGFAGAAVGTHVAGEDWDEERLFPVLEAAQSLGALVFVHPVSPRMVRRAPSHHLGNVIGNPMETTIAAFSMILGGVLDRLPDLSVMVSHAGGFTAAASGRLDHASGARSDVGVGGTMRPSSYLRRFAYDCISHDHAALRRLIELVGVDRIVVGTDYPADMGLARPGAWLTDGDLSAAERRAIEEENARRLLGDSSPRRLDGTR